MVDSELLAELTPKTSDIRTANWPNWLVALAFALAILGLAGPSWSKLPLPVVKSTKTLVLILDLSPSMYATDISPSRLERAKFKIQSLLDQRQEGFTGLVVFGGDAHVVAPLTDDSSTLENFLRTLEPNIMPVQGSNATHAMELAVELLDGRADQSKGHILLITDGIAQFTSLSNVRRGDYSVSILGVGTEDSGPIAIPDQRGTRLLQNSSGQLQFASLEEERLRDYAAILGGRYSSITVDDSDLELVSKPIELANETVETDREFDTWQDMGFLLCIPILVLLIPYLRAGVLVVLLVLVVQDSQANWLTDLFYTDDQKAHNALTEGRPDIAQELFESPAWKAVAEYRTGEFDQAASAFSNLAGERDEYNLGTSLAKGGHIEEALDVYNKLLEANPDHEDAQFNRDLLQQLLEEQQSEQTQQESEQNSSENADEQESAENDSQAQQEQQQDPSEQEQSDQQDADEAEESEGELAETPTPLDPAERESEDTYERWLRRVPDDPGGLLERKFRWTTQQRLQQGELRNGYGI